MHECCSRYGREEGGATFDADIAEPFLGDETTFKKRETAMTKRLVSELSLLWSCAYGVLLLNLSRDLLANWQWEYKSYSVSVCLRVSLCWRSTIVDEQVQCTLNQVVLVHRHEGMEHR